MPKIIFLDTFYTKVFEKINVYAPYDMRMEAIQKLHFGTSYYFSKSFQQMGWEAEDVIANDPVPFGAPGMAVNWILSREPDIVYCQDLGFLTDQDIAVMKARGIKVVAQHSCPWAGDDRIRKFDIVFTSFPHYIHRIKACGTRAEFLPIAFGHWALDHIEPQNRDIDISFVGGVNGPSGHWQKGTQLLEQVAETFPDRFQWWGYIIGNLPSNSALTKCYRGEAWGKDMYNILARSKIVINRHGEVAEGYSNNMRLFEATGMGACLFTEHSKNIDYYFEDKKEIITYRNTNELIVNIGDVIEDWETGHYYYHLVGSAGQIRTLAEHTYEKRLAQIEPILKDLIK